MGDSTSDRNANPVVSLQHGKLVLPLRPPGRLQDLRALLLTIPSQPMASLTPVGIFSFCLIVVSLLDRFSTAFPFNSTRCCNKDSRLHFSCHSSSVRLFCLPSCHPTRCSHHEDIPRASWLSCNAGSRCTHPNNILSMVARTCRILLGGRQPHTKG